MDENGMSGPMMQQILMSLSKPPSDTGQQTSLGVNPNLGGSVGPMPAPPPAGMLTDNPQDQMAAPQMQGGGGDQVMQMINALKSNQAMNSTPAPDLQAMNAMPYAANNQATQ